MGGYGSGRPGKRPVAEESEAWHIGDLRDAITQVVAAGPGAEYTGSIRWTRGIARHVVAACAFTLAGRPGGKLLLTLHYTCRGESVTDDTMLVSTRPNYGGQRWWFRCSGCHRRVGVLYAPGRFWRCRHCWRITYQSSNESDRRVSAILRSHDLSSLRNANFSDLLVALKALDRLRLR